MSLLYVKEHTSCGEYSSPKDAIFKLFEFEKGEPLEERLMSYTSIVFLLHGSIRLGCDAGGDARISAGYIVLLPQNTYIKGEALEKTCFLRCLFDGNMQICSRFSFENLSNFADAIEAPCLFYALPIRKRLKTFLELLVDCLNDGLGCQHYHRLKQSELYLLLRGYYRKEELAALFYPVLSHNWDLNDFVLSNYKKVKDVKELAALANQSPVTFNRHFKKAFGKSAAQWLESQKAKDIFREIRMTTKNFSEIASEYHFSSPAYFATFCKRWFKCSPKELREGQEG